MKNKFYSYFFKEFLNNFLTVLFALSAISWLIQAVNYFDFVTEDGYSLRAYFYYSILNYPKILTRLVPFVFILSLLYTFKKFQRNDEFLILWVSGLNKQNFVNFIVKLSFVFAFFFLILSTFINPYTLYKSRNVLKTSETNLIPALIKDKSFNDTIKGLTFFIDEKNKKSGMLKNIFIRDDSGRDGKSKTIIAKKGFIKKKGNQLYLFLENGIIQKEKKNGKINFIKFDKTMFNLSTFSPSTITAIKIQERNILDLLSCLNIIDYKSNYNCSSIKTSAFNEINRRLGMPIYIMLMSIIVSYMLVSYNENKNNYYDYLIFFTCALIMIFSEIFIRYSGKNFTFTTLFYLTPIFLILISYFNLYRLFNKKILDKVWQNV